jgi:hypothetical protein
MDAICGSSIEAARELLQQRTLQASPLPCLMARALQNVAAQLEADIANSKNVGGADMLHARRTQCSMCDVQQS